MEDLRGDLVERFKKKKGVPALEKGIQETVRKMNNFRVMRQVLEGQLDQQEEILKSVGQKLLEMMPKDPAVEPQGMNFGGEGQAKPDTQIRY